MIYRLIHSLAASILDFSFLEQPPSYISGSQSTINQVGSVSSFTSQKGNRRLKQKRSVTYHHSTNLKGKKSDTSHQNGGDQAAISEVAEAQRAEDAGVSGNRELGASESKSSLKSMKSRLGGLSEVKEEASPSGERKDPLTPIRELEQENSEYVGELCTKAVYDFKVAVSFAQFGV